MKRNRSVTKRMLCRVENLSVYYNTPRGPVHAVEDISFYLRSQERLGLVGESGSGKSTMALTVMRLIKPPAEVMSGKILLGDTDLLKLSESQMKDFRLSEIAMVAQGSMNSLNPVMRVRKQIQMGLQDHGVRLSSTELDERISALLATVGLQADVADMYPHELSGGMKQRVIIAIAISLTPSVIIADELTSALDVVVQRQVMETLRDVQAKIGAAVILVGHDMGLMAQFVQRLGVMYAGRLMEVSPVHEIFRNPRNPYTQLLITSLPNTEVKGKFTGIPGLPPSLLNVPSGCVFHPRCPLAEERCRLETPKLRELQTETWVACHLAVLRNHTMTALLEAKKITKVFGGGLFDKTRTIALQDFSMSMERSPASITAVVGESGSGKTTLARLLLGATDPTEGQILYKGIDMRKLDKAQRRAFLNDVQVIFQDPFEVYNPFYRVEHVLTMPIDYLQLAKTDEQKWDLVEDALETVGLRPDETIGRYPHQLSGGQRQRVMVARALIIKPSIILADEPVSMIDASLRATVLGSLQRLKEEFGISIIYITHDLTTAFQNRRQHHCALSRFGG